MSDFDWRRGRGLRFGFGDSVGRWVPGRVCLGHETLGNPLGGFPMLRREGLAFNEWLTERVLEPFLERWIESYAPDPEIVAEEADRACLDARTAFHGVLPAAIRRGDTAILAAFAVTANLERTVALIAEFLRDGGRPDAGWPADDGPTFWLSREWCGLVDYPWPTPYFEGEIHRPRHALRLDPRRRDPAHLTNALWRSQASVNARCDDAMAILGDAIRRSGMFRPGDAWRLAEPAMPFCGGGGESDCGMGVELTFPSQ
jgi:hypothetical protein